MAALVAVSAWLSIPFYPVPITLQTLAVLVAGGLLGSRGGPLVVGVYLGLGLVGVPVFHNGTAGLGILAHGTGGCVGSGLCPLHHRGPGQSDSGRSDCAVGG